MGRDGGEGSGGGAAGANGKDLDPAGHTGSLLAPCSVVVRAESGPDRGGFQTAPCEELLSFSDWRSYPRPSAEEPCLQSPELGETGAVSQGTDWRSPSWRGAV